MDTRTLAVVVAVLAACSGPRPRTEVIGVSPSPLPGHQRVTLELRNEGRGHGEVELEVTLTGATGRTLRERRTIELGEHARREVVVDIPAPAGSYVATASAKYPD